MLTKPGLVKSKMSIKELVLDILFPKRCIGCKREGKYICDKCELFISENSLICPVCGNPSFTGETHPDCRKKHTLDGLVGIWDYDGIIKDITQDIKYKGMFDSVNECIDKAFSVILEDPTKRFNPFLSFLVLENTYIAYTPMFRKKEKRRGFNQSRIIAKKMANVSNKKLISLIEKIINTESQTKLEREERFKNIKNSFAVTKPGLVKPNFVLVDDIFTTGATMRECCKTLKKSGVEKVWGFVLARNV